MTEDVKQVGTKPLKIAAAVAAALVVVALLSYLVFMIVMPGGEDGDKEATGPTVCGNKPPALAAAKYLRNQPYPMSIDHEGPYQVDINTSCGRLLVDLNPETAPIAVNNLVHLIRDHWYNGTWFFGDAGEIRVGDPAATGAGGPGYTIPDETPDQPYEVGSVLMWSGEKGAGSQFLIVTDPAQLQSLPPGMTTVGHLADEASLTVAKKIATVKPTRSGERVWILGAKVAGPKA